MVFNATFNQQYFSYIVTVSGHSRHRRAMTKNKKHTHNTEH